MFNKKEKIFNFFLIFILIFSWFFSDWSKVFNLPTQIQPQVQEAQALTTTKRPTAYTSTSFDGNWSFPMNATSSDNTYATAEPARNKEFATNWRGFDFSAIPDYSTINSVTVYIERKVSGAWSQGEFRASLWSDVTSGNALSSGVVGAIGAMQYTVSTAAGPTSDTYWSFPLTGTLPTYTQLKYSTFGIRVQIAKGNNGTTYTAFLDDIYLVVDYTLPAPQVFGTRVKGNDGRGGANPIYMNLIGGLNNTDYPYARASSTNTVSGITTYTPMTWSSANNRFEGVFYYGSNYCNGCVDPSGGGFNVTLQLDNNSDFSSINYSYSFTMQAPYAIIRKSSPVEATYDYTDYNPVWDTDHWNYTINDFTIYSSDGFFLTNTAVGIPFHPTTASISNIGVTFDGVTVNPGYATSTDVNAWWWNSDLHTLYVQFGGYLNGTYRLVDITFDSDTDLFATRYDRTQTPDMGDRVFYNGLQIANQYYTASIYGGGHEGAGEQAETHAHEPGGQDASTDCMERVAVHVDDTVLSDGSGYYNWDIKWKQQQWMDYIVSENNNQIVIVNDSDDTASTGWAQQLNNGISAKRTQTYYAGERYIKNLYELTNNGGSTRKYPLVWEREQWLYNDRQVNDHGRYQGDTSDVVMEQRNSLSSYSCPWMTAYDSGAYLAMGMVFQSSDLPDYGIFAVEPFLQNTTAPEWPIVITNPHGTQTTDQTGFEKTWASVAPSQTVDFTFYQIHYDTTSWANISTAFDADCAEINNSTFTQSAYRWFSNADSTQIGSTLTATQNSSTTLSTTGQAFRLRTLMHVASADVGVGGEDFKLQFATSTPGGCDTGFAGENYSDVLTGSGYIRYKDNTTPADGNLLTASTTDPTHGSDTIVNQTYEEVNNFTVTSTIAVGQDGKWDFSLYDASAPGDTTFCFRMVKSDNNLLDVYDVIPEIKTATGSGGSLTVDIVDSGGSSVSSPTVDMETSNLGFSCQTSTGMFGTSSERIRVENTTTGANWTLTVAATATTSVWSTGSLYYDFNDPNGVPNGCTDGGDADTYAGQMSMNPSVGVLTPEGGCSNTGISKGSSSAFNQGTVDNITLLSASSADTGCYWDFVDIDIAQQIPAEQPSGSYTIDLVVTVTAS